VSAFRSMLWDAPPIGLPEPRSNGVAEDARRQKSPALGLFTTLVRNCAWHSCPEPVIFRALAPGGKAPRTACGQRGRHAPVARRGSHELPQNLE
jgi:hypothetical protein